MNIHELKVYPKFFDEIVSGKKTFEIRKNDRDYAVRDFIIFKEWDGYYTNKIFNVRITYLLKHEDFPEGIPKDYVVFAIKEYGEVFNSE